MCDYAMRTASGTSTTTDSVSKTASVAFLLRIPTMPRQVDPRVTLNIMLEAHAATLSLPADRERSSPSRQLHHFIPAFGTCNGVHLGERAKVENTHFYHGGGLRCCPTMARNDGRTWPRVPASANRLGFRCFQRRPSSSTQLTLKQHFQRRPAPAPCPRDRREYSAETARITAIEARGNHRPSRYILNAGHLGSSRGSKVGRLRVVKPPGCGALYSRVWKSRRQQWVEGRK